MNQTTVNVLSWYPAYSWWGHRGHIGRLLNICSNIFPIITHDGSMVLLYMVTWIPSIYPLYVSIYTSTMDPSWVIVGCLPVIALDAVWIGNTTSRQTPCKQGEVQVNRNQVRAGYRNIFTMWDPEDRQVGFILLTSKNHDYKDESQRFIIFFPQDCTMPSKAMVLTC